MLSNAITPNHITILIVYSADRWLRDLLFPRGFTLPHFRRFSSFELFGLNLIWMIFCPKVGILDQHALVDICWTKRIGQKLTVVSDVIARNRDDEFRLYGLLLNLILPIKRIFEYLRHLVYCWKWLLIRACRLECGRLLVRINLVWRSKLTLFLLINWRRWSFLQPDSPFIIYYLNHSYLAALC